MALFINCFLKIEYEVMDFMALTPYFIFAKRFAIVCQLNVNWPYIHYGQE